MEEQNTKNSVWELIKFSIISLLIVIPIRFWIAQPFIVEGASMDPTFKNGDYLIVDEISYRFNEPRKGDVIVFHYPLDPSKYFIKRVVGLPGETITFNSQSVTLGDDEYFVMGDNRPSSSDSRIWGPVKQEFLVGRTIVRLWPFNKIEIMPGQDNNSLNQYK